jgi:DME family drug/metabolite transporter
MSPVYYRAMLIGLVLIGLASMSWGTTGATMILLGRHTAIGPLEVGWARLAVAAPCLMLATVAGKRLARLRPTSAARRAGESAWAARALPLHALLGLAMASYQVCYFWAVTLTGVAVAALIAICSAPLLIALLALALLGERPTRTVGLSLWMAVIGTALLVVGPRGLGETSGHWGLGALLALGAGLSYAVYAVAAKHVLQTTAPLPVATTTFTLAALFLAPVALAHHAPLGVLRAGWPLLLYLGVVPTAVAYVLFTVGLRRVPATAAGIVSLLEPLTATLLGVLAFHEALGAMGFVGAGLLLASLVLLTTTAPRPIRAGVAAPRSAQI